MVRVAAQRRARRVPRSGTPWVPRRSALGGGFEATAGGLHPCNNRVFLSDGVKHVPTDSRG